MARSIVLYLMLLQRQIVLSPRIAGCNDSSSLSAIPAALNTPALRRLPDARLGPRGGGGGRRDRQPQLRQRAGERERPTRRPLLAHLRTPHCPILPHTVECAA